MSPYQENKNNMFGAVRNAARNGDAAAIEALIVEGTPIDINEVDSLGRTPLHYPAMDGYLAVVMTLVENGGAMDVQDNRGQTPLHMAAAFGNIDILEVLCAQGANLDIKNRHGCTPIQFAAEEDQFEAVKVLNMEGAEAHDTQKCPSGSG